MAVFDTKASLILLDLLQLGHLIDMYPFHSSSQIIAGNGSFWEGLAVGDPHCGHASALSEISFEHSEQLIRAIPPPKHGCVQRYFSPYFTRHFL
jgi:hypothetical protein